MKPFDPEAYTDEAAAAIGLSIPAHCKPGVIANLARLAAMADTLFAFPLPDTVENDKE
jgi:hypothetical protein